MKHQRLDLRVPVLVALATCMTATTKAAEADAENRQLPTLKFFYYDSESIEWIVSAEPVRFEQHLQANEDSARLFGSLTAAVDEQADAEQVRAQMARWLDGERERIGNSAGNMVRLRKAEGIVAYLRAHDFSIEQLVQQLLKRSGASDVELVAVHLVGTGGTSFQLKVVLPDEQIGMGRQGFNIAFQSPEVTYTSVVYALGLALYEVHEIINAESGAEAPIESDVEPLPAPGLIDPVLEDRLGG